MDLIHDEETVGDPDEPRRNANWHNDEWDYRCGLCQILCDTSVFSAEDGWIAKLMMLFVNRSVQFRVMKGAVCPVDNSIEP
jgi:hypothetical protein